MTIHEATLREIIEIHPLLIDRRLAKLSIQSDLHEYDETNDRDLHIFNYDIDNGMIEASMSMDMGDYGPKELQNAFDSVSECVDAKSCLDSIRNINTLIRGPNTKCPF